MHKYITEENYDITMFAKQLINDRIIDLTEQLEFSDIGLIKSLDQLEDECVIQRRLVAIHNLAKAKRVLMENYWAMENKLEAGEAEEE